MKIFTSAIIIFAFTSTQWMQNVNIVQANPKKTNGKKVITDKNMERINNIMKLPNDHRLYRGLRLSNGMKILLISDPLTKKSASNFVVGVGSLDDPRGIPGLATLVGYLMIIASKKFPKPYNLQKFVENQGGMSPPPVTDTSEQNFGFVVDYHYLAQTLERFAELFREPLWVDEFNFVDIDNAILLAQKNFTDHSKFDVNRIMEVEKSISKTNHPYNHLYDVNEETLYQEVKDVIASPEDDQSMWRKKWLRDKALKFYSTWYSSNIMTLTVLGRESLDKLEEMVVPLFESFENKKVKQVIYSCKHHPWGEEQLKKKIYVVPSVELNLLRLVFPVPDVEPFYRTAPEEYLRYLLRHGNPDSVSSTLRSKDLCTTLQTSGRTASGIAFFTIVCKLTEIGISLVDDIVHLIFQYIRLVRKEGIEEWIFDEMKSSSKISYLENKGDRTDPLDTVEHLASAMQVYPLEDILTYDYIQNQWDPSLVKKFLSYFRPDNANVIIISELFAGIADQEETYFKTPFKVVPISDEMIERWRTEDLIPDLRLPGRNIFLPQNFDLYSLPKNEPKSPYIIHESSISEVWFKQDDEFETPKLYLHLDIRCSIRRSDPTDVGAWHLFESILTKCLVVYLHEYYMEESIYTWETEVNERGLVIKSSGYADKFPQLLESLIKQMIDLKNHLEKVNFLKFRNRYIKSLEKKLAGDYFFQMSTYAMYLQKQDQLSDYTILKALKLLQYGDMKEFLRRVFRRVFMRALIHGNCNRQKAMDIVNIIEKPFLSSKGMLSQELMLIPRYAEIAAGFHFMYRIFNNSYEYRYSSHFQLNTEPSARDDVIGCILYEIITQFCVEIFSKETRNQNIGLLECTLYQKYGIRGLVTTTQILTDPRCIDDEIEALLSSICRKLKNLSNSEYNSIKRRVEADGKCSKPSSLGRLTGKIWDEISLRQYRFNRTEMEHEQLRAVKKTDVLAFFESMLNTGGPQRRRLSIFVFPEETKLTNPALVRYIPFGATRITDADAFRGSSILLPLYYSPPPP